MSSDSYFDDMKDANALYASYLHSRKGSSWKESVQRYDMHFLRNIAKTQRELENGTYRQMPFYEFQLNERGKTRHIRSMHFSDRVLQRSLCDTVLIPALVGKLTYDNGASMKGKGISFTRGRLQAHLEKYIRRHGTEGWVMVMDFSKFFDNISHEKLLDMVEPVIQDQRICQLLEHLIDTFKVDVSYMDEVEYQEAHNAVFNSVEYEKIPDSLKTGRQFLYKSLGIGSQISQISGVFFPTAIDNFIKIVCRMKYYGRYMDDLYIIHHSKERLREVYKGVRQIASALGLHINVKKTQITPLKRGFSFMQVKYSVTPSGHILKRVKPDRFTRERRKLKKYRSLLSQGSISRKDISNAYQSWKGNLTQFKCKQSIHNMDYLYTRLFVR